MSKYIYYENNKLVIPYDGLVSYWKSIKEISKILGISDENNIDNILYTNIIHYIPFRILDGALFPHFEQCIGGIEQCSHPSYKNNSLYMKTMVGSIEIVDMPQGQNSFCPLITNPREFSITKIKGYYAKEIATIAEKFPKLFHETLQSKKDLKIPMSQKIFDLISIKSNNDIIKSLPVKFTFAQEDLNSGIDLFKNNNKTKKYIAPSAIKLRYEVTLEQELCMKTIGKFFVDKENDPNNKDFLVTLKKDAAEEVINHLADSKKLTFKITESPSAKHFIDFTLPSEFAVSLGQTLDLNVDDLNINNVVEIMLDKDITPKFDVFIKGSFSSAKDYFINDLSLGSLEKTQILSGCTLYTD